MPGRVKPLGTSGALEWNEGELALADRVGLGSRQLRRLFLARTGATPIAVHSTRRLLMAKQLLTETSMPVIEVALASGFNSLRRFNAAFREGCGMPPTAIRRLNPQVPAGTMSLRLGYRPPFDFGAALAFLARRAIPGIERVTGSSYERLIGASTWIRVTAHAHRPELLLEPSDADPRAIPDIVRRVRRVFDLDADMATVHAAFEAAPLLVGAVQRRPGLRVPGGWDGFEVAVRAVLGLQVSVAGATTLARRLVEQYGEKKQSAREGLDRSFPFPATLADAPLEKLGLPRGRANRLRAVAAAAIDGRIDFRFDQGLDDVALRALSHPDAFPAGDLVVRVLGGGEPISEREAEARSEAWRPWRAYAVLHLWHLADDLQKEKR